MEHMRKQTNSLLGYIILLIKKYGSSYLEKKNVSNKLKKIYEPKVNF